MAFDWALAIRTSFSYQSKADPGLLFFSIGLLVYRARPDRWRPTAAPLPLRYDSMSVPVIIVLLSVGNVAFTMFIGWVLIRSSWAGLAQPFPAQQIGSDAVRKNFQSFRIGIVKLGFSVHVAVDEQYLHLIPARLIRLFGARTASIPWNQVSFTGRKGKRNAVVKIGANTVMGPAWCLEMAEPPPSEES